VKAEDYVRRQAHPAVRVLSPVTHFFGGGGGGLGGGGTGRSFIGTPLSDLGVGTLCSFTFCGRGAAFGGVAGGRRSFVIVPLLQRMPS
jgi:hypothetical protein